MLRSKASAMERALAASPDDKGLRITLLSARRMADRAEEELAEIAEQSDVDLCRYRVKREQDGNYPAAMFAESVVTYQDLFTALYDFVKNGAKSVASYTKEVRQRSLLNIAYTYPGSIGILLAIPNQRDLFDEGELDQIVDAMSQVVELQTIDQVRAVAGHMGLNVVRNLFKWADKNWKSDFSVDIQWARSDSVARGGHVTRSQLFKLTSLIQQTSDEQSSEKEVLGTLVGLHVLSDTFSITTAGGETYSGRLATGFDKREYRLPHEYRAKMGVKTTIKYATEATTVTYSLLALEEI
jgi:hypothetical protein